MKTMDALNGPIDKQESINLDGGAIVALITVARLKIESLLQWEDNAASGIESSWFFIFHPGGVGKWRNYVKRWPDDDKTAAEGGGKRWEIRRTKGTIIGKSRNFPFGLLFGIDPLVYWSKLFASIENFCFVVSCCLLSFLFRLLLLIN